MSSIRIAHNSGVLGRLKTRIAVGLVLTVLLTLADSAVFSGEDCKRAVELYNRGVQTKDLSDKEKCFKQALSLCSRPSILARVYNNLADTYEKSDKLSLALTFYRKALETKPDLATSYFSVGDIFFRLKDYCSAAAMYAKGLRYRPDDEVSRQRKAEAEELAKRYVIIYFDFDSAVIADRYLRRLEAIGEALDEAGSDRLVQIRVMGHTCSLGPVAYNKQLSMRRARAVAAYLKEVFAVEPRLLSLSAMGDDVPLLGGDDRNTRILNRRVEIELCMMKEN